MHNREGSGKFHTFNILTLPFGFKEDSDDSFEEVDEYIVFEESSDDDELDNSERERGNIVVSGHLQTQNLRYLEGMDLYVTALDDTPLD